MSDETLTLYHAAPSRGSIVLWMLEEVGAPYRVELLDLNAGDQKRPEYLAINPAFTPSNPTPRAFAKLKPV